MRTRHSDHGASQPRSQPEGWTPPTPAGSADTRPCQLAAARRHRARPSARRWSARWCEPPFLAVSSSTGSLAFLLLAGRCPQHRGLTTGCPPPPALRLASPASTTLAAPPSLTSSPSCCTQWPRTTSAPAPRVSTRARDGQLLVLGCPVPRRSWPNPTGRATRNTATYTCIAAAAALTQCNVINGCWLLPYCYQPPGRVIGIAPPPPRPRGVAHGPLPPLAAEPPSATCGRPEPTPPPAASTPAILSAVSLV